MKFLTKRYKINFLLIVLSLFFACIFSTTASYSQSSPDPSSSLTLGVRTDVPEIKNYCDEFGRFLEMELRELLTQEVQVETRSVLDREEFNSDYERFIGVRNGIIDIECGSNSKPVESITESSIWEGIAFSENFYTTGIKLLVKAEFVPESQDPTRWIGELGGSIGVTDQTTTFERLSNEPLYRNSLEPYSTKDEALDALEQNATQAFASDAIILRAILDSRFESTRDSYKIFPENYILGLSEAYAIVVKADATYLQGLLDSEDLLATINETLLEDELVSLANDLRSYEANFPSPSPSSPRPEENWWKENWWKILLAVILFCLIGVLVIVILKALNIKASDR